MNPFTAYLAGLMAQATKLQHVTQAASGNFNPVAIREARKRGRKIRHKNRGMK